jgi:hypothetical protein
MLTDCQIKDLAKRMNIPLERVCFKDQLTQKPLKYNRSYIVNMENEYGEEGERNEGSHWVCFQVNKYKSGVKEGIYFDSYGEGMPEIVEKYCGKIPHNKIDIQSLLEGTCGYYCLAFLHFINASPCRSGHLYTDAEGFMSMFDDLNKSIDYKKNEFVLKHFFEPKEKSLRKPITV